MASTGSKGSKSGRAKRTPSNVAYKTNDRLSINKKKRLKKDAILKGKHLTKVTVPRGTARQKRRSTLSGDSSAHLSVAG